MPTELDEVECSDSLPGRFIPQKNSWHRIRTGLASELVWAFLRKKNILCLLTEEKRIK